MAQAKEKEKGAGVPDAVIATAPIPTTPARSAAGRAGEKRMGGAAKSAVRADLPPVLTKENLRVIGRTLNGAHWQADIASLIGLSKSQVTRFLNGQRELNPLISQHLQYVVVERIIQLAQLLHVEGMPYAGSRTAEDVILAIEAAVDKVPGQEPPRER